jgi:pSer/pThr/pTyr-binding forkhead associated (FHA) protein
LITLDRTDYTVGRSHAANIELFSPTASRLHARLTNRGGRWYVSPVENRVVRLNGSEVRAETALTHKSRLQLGGDELLFLDETAPAESVPVAPVRQRRRLWIALLLVTVTVGAAAAWWFLNR